MKNPFVIIEISYAKYCVKRSEADALYKKVNSLHSDPYKANKALADFENEHRKNVATQLLAFRYR